MKGYKESRLVQRAKTWLEAALEPLLQSLVFANVLLSLLKIS